MAHAPSKDTSCKKETESMRVSFVVRNERVYIADTSEKDGIGQEGKRMKRLRGMVRRAVLGCDKNMAVRNGRVHAAKRTSK